MTKDSDLSVLLKAKEHLGNCNFLPSFGKIENIYVSLHNQTQKELNL